MKNREDWSYGCEPDFNLSCDENEYRFLKLPRAEFYGYDVHSSPNYTFTDCQNLCLQRCECKGFEHSFSFDEGIFYCYTKTLLTNGYQVPSYSGDTYMKLPKNYHLSDEESKLNCSDRVIMHAKIKSHENQTVRFILWFATGIGGLEIILFYSFGAYWLKPNKTPPSMRGATSLSLPDSKGLALPSERRRLGVFLRKLGEVQKELFIKLSCPILGLQQSNDSTKLLAKEKLNS